MSVTPPSQNMNIAVNDQGDITLNGRVVDILGIVFQVQKETSALAQDILSFVAERLFQINQDSKMAVEFLNQIRALRPTGDADSDIDDGELENVVNDFIDDYGKNPFTLLDLKDFEPDAQYKVTMPDGKEKTYDDEDDFHLMDEDGISTLKIDETETRSITLNHYKYDTSPYKFEVTKTYKDNMKQAELDQLIEGVKSHLSTLNSDQELLQNNTKRYSQMSDETSEAMSSIEKNLFSSATSLEGKI